MKTLPLKWHGGKTYLAKWILSHFPDRESYTHYCEPYAGGLSVLFAHDPEGKAESVNDLNEQLSDFWFVLANTPDRMLRQLWGTPLSEPVWSNAAQELADMDRVRRATAFFIRYRQSRQGLGQDFVTPTKRTRRGMNEHVSAWWSAIDSLPEAHQRLKRVEIRNMDATKFIELHDHSRALFYLDPPYMHETRTSKNTYDHEMSFTDHCALLECLANIKGQFLLSGYHSDLYDNWSEKHGFRVVEKKIDNKASGAKHKPTQTECLWMKIFH